MIVFLIVGLVAAGYLSGSVNYAILVTRLVARRDIRELGNRNPGTANVARSIGKAWAVPVYFGDLLKGLIPMLLVRLFVFTGDAALDLLVIAAVGIAAIGGHCRPVFHGFRGGGGMATSMGVFLFFIPIEFVACMLLSALFVMLFIRHAEFRVGRAIPITFVTVTPFATLVLNPFVNVSLGAHITIGGHPWYVLLIAFAVSLFILAMNFSFVRSKAKGDAVSGAAPMSDD